MVTVLHRGTPPSEYMYKCTCSTCKSVISYKATEAETITGIDQRDGTYRQLTCPVCKSIINDWSKPLIPARIPEDAVLRELQKPLKWYE